MDIWIVSKHTANGDLIYNYKYSLEITHCGAGMPIYPQFSEKGTNVACSLQNVTPTTHYCSLKDLLVNMGHLVQFKTSTASPYCFQFRPAKQAIHNFTSLLTPHHQQEDTKITSPGGLNSWRLG